MKPIIFNTEMVKAILDGRKTCTRRPLKNIPSDYELVGYVMESTDRKIEVKAGFRPKGSHEYFYINGKYERPPYQKGDILYVRETWAYLPMGTTGRNPLYRATDTLYNNIKWKPSIHMPKDVARLLLKVTDVRIERVQDISDDDCLREGIVLISNYPDEYFCRDYSKKRSIENWTFFNENENEKEYFKTLWDSIYKTWDSNPWVWVIDFEIKEIK